MVLSETRDTYKVLSISTEGNTVTTYQKFASFSAALDTELKYFTNRKKVPAQINIEEE